MRLAEVEFDIANPSVPAAHLPYGNPTPSLVSEVKMTHMTGTRPQNPFEWYIGKAIPIRGRFYVVEQSEVRGHDLSFLLRDQVAGNMIRVPAVELLRLELQESYLS